MDGGPNARGGRNLFSWSDVASQPIKDRECYLGQAVMVGMQGRHGRFAKNEWWRSRENEAAATQEELEEVKQRERELMEKQLQPGKKQRMYGREESGGGSAYHRRVEYQSDSLQDNGDRRHYYPSNDNRSYSSRYHDDSEEERYKRAEREARFGRRDDKWKKEPPLSPAAAGPSSSHSRVGNESIHEDLPHRAPPMNPADLDNCDLRDLNETDYHRKSGPPSPVERPASPTEQRSSCYPPEEERSPRDSAPPPPPRSVHEEDDEVVNPRRDHYHRYESPGRDDRYRHSSSYHYSRNDDRYGQDRYQPRRYNSRCPQSYSYQGPNGGSGGYRYRPDRYSDNSRYPPRSGPRPSSGGSYEANYYHRRYDNYRPSYRPRSPDDYYYRRPRSPLPYDSRHEGAHESRVAERRSSHHSDASERKPDTNPRASPSRSNSNPGAGDDYGRYERGCKSRGGPYER